MFESFPRSTQCVGCGAFVTICLRGTWQIYSLSPRPEISNRRIRGGFNFLFGTYGFKRQNSFVMFESFPRLDTKCRLRGIRDNLPAWDLANLLIVAPTRDKQKGRILCDLFI